MDDEDFNSELLGAAQRQHNLRQNEATRQEIAALRADLKRKEAEEKAAPKCPYCFGVTTEGAVKCRHCASDLKWCEVEGKAYPIKIDDDPEAFIVSKKKELEAKKKEQEETKRVADKAILDLEARVKVFLFEEKNKIAAIKYVREQTHLCDGGLGLADAKEQVDRIESGQNFLLGESGKLMNRSGSGCLVAACTIPAGLLAFKAVEYFLA